MSYTETTEKLDTTTTATQPAPAKKPKGPGIFKRALAWLRVFKRLAMLERMTLLHDQVIDRLAACEHCGTIYLAMSLKPWVRNPRAMNAGVGPGKIELYCGNCNQFAKRDKDLIPLRSKQ